MGERDDSEVCLSSERVDGKLHSWSFDGDDPYVVCCWCGEVRDSITGGVIKPVAPAPTQPTRAEELLKRFVKYAVEDRAITPGTTRLARLTKDASAYLRERGLL